MQTQLVFSTLALLTQCAGLSCSGDGSKLLRQQLYCPCFIHHRSYQVCRQGRWPPQKMTRGDFILLSEQFSITFKN